MTNRTAAVTGGEGAAHVTAPLASAETAFTMGATDDVNGRPRMD
ncbi:hypothetical protein [Actinomadura roseirufa]|nr:hypothetical protein [Actinomadura roseirufa]